MFILNGITYKTKEATKKVIQNKIKELDLCTIGQDHLDFSFFKDNFGNHPVLLSNHDDLVEAIVSKLEVDLPEFDKTKIYDEKYRGEFAQLLQVWTEGKSENESFGFLKEYQNSIIF